MDPDAVGITAGEQRRSRGGTDRLSDVKIGESAAFAREPVEIRRLKSLGGEATDIAISLIVGKDDDDIRQPIGRAHLERATLVKATMPTRIVR